MTEYHCKAHVRVLFLLILLLSGTATLCVLLLPGLRSAALQTVGEYVWLSFPVVLFFGGFACWGVSSLLSTFTVYRLDEQGISKRLWNGSIQQLGWHEIAHSESGRRGALTLIDQRGGRMTVAPAGYGYHSHQGHDLRHQLEIHLKSAHRAIPTPVLESREFQAGAAATAACLVFLGVMAIAGAVAMPLVASSSTTTVTNTYGFVAGSIVAALLFFFMAVQLATRVITLTASGIIDRTFFRRKEIPYAEIQSIVMIIFACGLPLLLGLAALTQKARYHAERSERRTS